MQLKFDFNNMMMENIGNSEGFNSATFVEDREFIQKAFNSVMDNRGKGWQEWTSLPDMPAAEVDAIIKAGNEIREKADSFVVFGIGGSALGPLAVANSLLHLRHNELPKAKRKAPKLYVEDNVDPERMKALLDVIKIKDTYFNVITKSGETSETLSQFLIIYEILKKKLGAEEAKSRIIVTTTIGKGTLYELAKKEGFKTFGIGKGVGGRFSVLSAVGLLPFAALGIDIKEMLRGAKEMSEASAGSDMAKNPALMSAYMQYRSIKMGRNISVLMPYADSLKYMADFYCQLWGESLGKAVDLDGKTVNVGQTPVKSLGVTDQHSQVQLYTEGPLDKVVTFLAVDNFRNRVVIPANADAPSTAFLQKQTMNNLINFERRATEYALKKAERANFTVYLPVVTAETVGELLQYFMYQTAFCGAMLNIDTFNQPGVEEGKLATFAMMKREGYEAKLKEINRARKSDKYFINKK